MWGLPGVGEQQWVPGPGGVPAQGTAGRARGVQGQAARRASALPLHAKAAKANLRLLFTQLSPSLFSHTKTSLQVSQ